jgi:hypothetical protein
MDSSRPESERSRNDLGAPSKRSRRLRARRARLRRRARRRATAGLSPALHALTTSALALPGIAGSASADTPSSEYTAEYSYSRYQEDDLSSSKVAPGQVRERYEVDMHQVRLGAPLGERMDLTLDLSHETMSGASPWYVDFDQQSGRVVQVMSGATIDDRRTDALLDGTYYFDRSTASLSGGFSIEKDYRAINVGLEGTRDYNEKNTTLSGGLGGSFDEIDPTQDPVNAPDRPGSDDKQSASLFAGVSQVLDRSTTVQATASYQHARGFLSDPYKRAVVAGTPLPDRRPDDRNQLALLARLRRHFETLNGTLHADYRYYLDDWSIEAHTFDVAWHQSLFDLLRVIPSVRYYSQSQADFYAPFYFAARSDGLRSSDYRLSPYGALSYRIRSESRLQLFELDLMLNASYERYESDGDLAFGRVSTENPGLVSFELFSVGISGRF